MARTNIRATFILLMSKVFKAIWGCFEIELIIGSEPMISLRECINSGGLDVFLCFDKFPSQHGLCASLDLAIS